MGPLLLGSALAVLALVYVLWPLFREVRAGSAAVVERTSGSEASAVEALREIEFDRATGKLSDEDYATLRATYAPRALAELDARAAGPTSAVGVATEDAAEQLIARARQRTACPGCGPRPETDALFCSDCGRYLAAACLRCGASVDAPQARFCTDCGQSLAA